MIFTIIFSVVQICPHALVLLSKIVKNPIKVTRMCRMKFFASILVISSIALPTFAARPTYQVNMRLNLKGYAPLALNTPAKTGKKTSVSQFSDDGYVETIVEVVPREIVKDNKNHLKMDLTVTRRVKGEDRVSEKMQILVPENQETEEGNRKTSNLSVAVMAHKL